MPKQTTQYTSEELEALESVQPSPAQEAEVPREPRHLIAIESPLSPESLCGSWALYHADDTTLQGLIVGEPFAGIFLVEMYDLVTDTPYEQRLTKIERLASVDEGGGVWTFYDDRKGVRGALKRLMS